MKAKFAPFDTLLGAEIVHAGAARLIHEHESMEEYAETHHHQKVEVEEVDVMKFSTFVNEVVAKRKLPTSSQVIKPNVIMKMDVEGAELKVGQ